MSARGRTDESDIGILKKSRWLIGRCSRVLTLFEVSAEGMNLGVEKKWGTRGEVPETRWGSQSCCGIFVPAWQMAANQCLDKIKWEIDQLDMNMVHDYDKVKFSCCSVRATIDRYKKATADSSNSMSTSEANTQFYQQEATKLRRLIREIQTSNRQILGDGVSSMALRELKNMEGKLEKAISRVRSKKNELLFAEIELMQKRKTIGN
ncbi:UNVERIFIED_CONTAM: Agamous-like MADS-box protein MADS1 [Sesamum angustifolium]|uniref:Agamous-like MADS-box protein MADS1 n=1 Tax=Sesamum angustifolium TaxID=2727405 RepID=A0AAW2IVE2_9LAMI